MAYDESFHKVTPRVIGFYDRNTHRYAIVTDLWLTDNWRHFLGYHLLPFTHTLDASSKGVDSVLL